MTRDGATGVTVETRGEEATEALGRRLGAALPPGTVVGVDGRLGAGKTVFARGVAAGLGIDPASVSSPTFTYLAEYPEGRVPFVHADLYRLGHLEGEALAGAFEAVGLADAVEGEGVVLVEWWTHWRGPAPRRLVRVELAAGSGDVRSIHLEFLGPDLGAARRAVEP